MSGIGSLNEKPLHAALKAWYRRPGDQVEVAVEGFVVDIVRGDTLIEIQTGGFSPLRGKVDALLDRHRIRLVHPVAATKWIVKIDEAGGPISKRRSPKRGMPLDVCSQLVSFPSLLSHPNFTVDVLLVDEEETWQLDSSRGWRRGGFVVAERSLVEVGDSFELVTPADLVALLPNDLPDPFTTADLAARLRRPRRLAQQIAYCLRVSGAVDVAGRDEGGYRYRLP